MTAHKKNDGWHDINKELPEDGQECLVYYKNKYYDIKIYYENNKYKYWDEVIAWKILIPPVI